MNRGLGIGFSVLANSFQPPRTFARRRFVSILRLRLVLRL
jgi:hypothetical protein